MNTIYAWGYGDVLEKILQGIATLFSTNGGLMVMLGKIAILIAFMIVLLSYFSSAGLRDPLRVVRFYIVLLGVWTLFMQVKTTVQVDDVQANRTVVVDNVPWAIARPLAFLSQVQKTLAGYLDQAFGLPDACQYSKSGMFTCFGVLNSALNFRITDPYLYTSLNYFIQNCVYTNILDGTYDLDQLLTSDNIINMFGQNLHPSRFTKVFGPNDCPINQPCSGPCKQGCTLDCPTAWGVIQGQLNSYIAQAPSIIGGLNMMSATAVSDILGIAPSYLLQSSQTGASFLLQTVGINHFQDAYLRWAEANLAPGLGYGVGTAQRQVEQTGITSSFMAGKYLPVIKGIVAVLIAGLTPTLFILLLTPMAMRALQGTAILFVWLLTWTLGDALLNAIIQVKLSGMNFASLSGTAPITSLTLPVVSQTMMDYISMAGQFYWLIPTISLMASTGFGIYAMNSVVSAVSSSPQSASSQAGSQTATGNVQAGTVHYNEVGASNLRMGNTHWGNSSIANTSFMTASTHQRHIGNFSKLGGGETFRTSGGSLRDVMQEHAPYLSATSRAMLTQIGKALGEDARVVDLNVINGNIVGFKITDKDNKGKIEYDGNILTYTDSRGGKMELGIENGRLKNIFKGENAGIDFQAVEELAKLTQAQKIWTKALETARQAKTVEQAQEVLSKAISDIKQVGLQKGKVVQDLEEAIRYTSQGSAGHQKVAQDTKGTRQERGDRESSSHTVSKGVEGKLTLGGRGKLGPSLEVGGYVYGDLSFSGFYKHQWDDKEEKYSVDTKYQDQSTTNQQNEGGNITGEISGKRFGLPNRQVYSVQNSFTLSARTQSQTHEQSKAKSFVDEVAQKTSQVFSQSFSEVETKLQKLGQSTNVKMDSNTILTELTLREKGDNINNLADVIQGYEQKSEELRGKLLSVISPEDKQRIEGTPSNVKEAVQKEPPKDVPNQVGQGQAQAQEGLEKGKEWKKDIENKVSPQKPKKSRKPKE